MEYLWAEIYGAEAAKFVDILKEKLEGDELQLCVTRLRTATDMEQISEDQVQRNLFGHKSGSIFPKLLCSVSVREGEGYEKQGRVQLTMKVL